MKFKFDITKSTKEGRDILRAKGVDVDKLMEEAGMEEDIHNPALKELNSTPGSTLFGDAIKEAVSKTNLRGKYYI